MDGVQDFLRLSASIQRDPQYNRLSVRCREFLADGGLLEEWRRQGGQVEGPTPEPDDDDFLRESLQINERTLAACKNWGKNFQ